MRDHAIVSPRFWTGETGRLLRQHPDAQRLALYLMTCPSSNMIGLYYLPVPTICHELNLSPEGASEGLRRLSEGGFAVYDEGSEVVFVREMARFQIGDALSPTDNRTKAVHKLLTEFRKCRLLRTFYERYGAAYHLPAEFAGSPFEGASKPLRSQDQDQEQDSLLEPAKPASREGGKVTKAAAKKRPPKADRKARPRDELFDAIAEVTGADPGTQGSFIGDAGAELRKGTPTAYTPAEVRDFGRRFWELCPWAAEKQMDRPTVGTVVKHIHLVRLKPPPAASPPPPSPDFAAYRAAPMPVAFDPNARKTGGAA